MKVSIVIPNWNGIEKLKIHLPRVLEVARFNNIEEVIVSDDASEDESVSFVKNNFPKVIVIERQQNRGFSSNVNTGFEKSHGDIVFLLNNDAVPDKNFLQPALLHFKNPRVFSVGCNAGGLWAIAKFENGFFWHGQPSIKTSNFLKPHQTLWASGGSAFFNKKIWDELGGLDPLFNPFYEEDVDLGYRATKRGLINIWEPKSKVEHYNEVGVIAANFPQNKIKSIAERNHLLFIWKNITSKKLFSEHKKALLNILLTHPRYWLIFLAALVKLPSILSKRKIEKVQAQLSDEEIFAIFAGK